MNFPPMSKNLMDIVSAGLDPAPQSQLLCTSTVSSYRSLRFLFKLTLETGGGLTEAAFDAHIQFLINGWKVMKANNQDVSIAVLAYGEK